MKKEKVNIDIISFGEDEENQEKLSQFINTLNGAEGNSCHLVSIPAGTSLSDALRKSPIIDGGDGGGAASAGGFDMDADAAADPELAMALRISLEEQRARQQQSGADNNETKEDNNQAQPMDQDQQMLQDALLMSMGGGAEAMGGGAPMGGGAEADLGGMTEEEQIAYAIQMSMAESAPSDSTSAAKPEPMEDDSSQLVTDPEFLQTVLQNLPGVDPNSEAVKEALGESKKNEDDKKKDDK